MNNLQEKILNKIKSGELSMQPRSHFALRTTLFVVGIVIAALIAVYLLSFVFFVLHRSGLSLAPAFGMRGILFLVVSSPWLLIGAVLVFLVTLYVLVQHFAFSYKRPLVYSMVGTAVAVLLVSTFIHYMMMHDRVRTFVEEHEVPGMSSWYRDQDRRPDGVAVGMVGALVEHGFILLRDDTGEAVSIGTGTDTYMPLSRDLQIGDRVIVFGDKEGETIQAFGVRLINDADDLPPPRLLPAMHQQ